MQFVIDGQDFSHLEGEVRQLRENMRPFYIRNMVFGTVRPTQRCQFWQAPLEWTTKCGWKRATSTRNIEHCNEEDLGKFGLCSKCFT